jgi:hypothetical protein
VRLRPLSGPLRAEDIPARTRPGQRTGSSGRTPGSSADRRRVGRSSGSSNGSRRTRSQKAGDSYPGRHVVSWAGQIDGAGSREDLPEFGGLRKVRSIDPDGPARTLLPVMESGWHGRSTRIPAAQPGKGSSGESRLGRTKQAKAPARVMGSEATRLRSDSQEQDSDWLRISGPNAGPFRPGLESVARLFTSLFSEPAQHLQLLSSFPSSEVIAPRPSLLVFARPPALCESGGASLTGFSRATHAWDRLSAGTPAHAVTAVTAVPAP